MNKIDEILAKHSENYAYALSIQSGRSDRVIIKSSEAKSAMIEFAKLHVQAALEAAANMGKKTWDWTTEECNSIIEDAYPENLIQ